MKIVKYLQETVVLSRFVIDSNANLSLVLFYYYHTKDNEKIIDIQDLQILLYLRLV